MLHIIIFINIAAFSLGLSAVSVSLRLYRLYRYKYLLAYFYYLLFLNLGSLAGLIFCYYSTNLQENLTTYQYNTYLIIDIFAVYFPMMACTYAFIILTTSIVEKVLPKILKYLYFIAFGLFLLIYFYGLKEFIKSESMQLFLLNHTIESIFILSVTMVAIIQILFNARKLQNSAKQKAVKIFAFLYLLIYTIICICFFLPRTANTISNSLLFLSLNIVPILYLRRYLQRSYWDILAEPEREKMINGLYAKHNISKREKEVIYLIL